MLARSHLMIVRGVPSHIRTDTGSDFWANAFSQSLHGRATDEGLKDELFNNLMKVKTNIEIDPLSFQQSLLTISVAARLGVR